MKTTILPRQSLLDIALLTKGNAASAVDIAIDNHLILTDDLLAGQVLEIGIPLKNTVTNIINQMPPATSITEVIKFQGINFMVVEGTSEDRFWVR